MQRDLLKQILKQEASVAWVTSRHFATPLLFYMEKSWPGQKGDPTIEKGSTLLAEPTFGFLNFARKCRTLARPRYLAQASEYSTHDKFSSHKRDLKLTLDDKIVNIKDYNLADDHRHNIIAVNIWRHCQSTCKSCIATTSCKNVETLRRENDLSFSWQIAVSHRSQWDNINRFSHG